MSLFSLPTLLENETVREWLLCRTEHSLQPSTIETAYALKAGMEIDSCTSCLEFLLKPVGVVNGILIGYILGDPYYFALPKSWGAMVHPACRRFIFDLEKAEFLEFHWYVHNETVLVNWMKFPTTEHRIRYFILFEAPEVDKLPYKLLHSVEVVTERVSEGIGLQSGESFQLPTYVKTELNTVPTFLSTFQNLLGVFAGTYRWTSYSPENSDYIGDALFSYSISIRYMEFAEHLKKRELQRFSHCFTSMSFMDANAKHVRCLWDSCNDSLEGSIQDGNLFQYVMDRGISRRECMICQLRQQDSKIIRWTDSWNYVPEDYLASQETLSIENVERTMESEGDTETVLDWDFEQLVLDSCSTSSFSLSKTTLSETNDVTNANLIQDIYSQNPFYFMECSDSLSVNEEIFEDMFSSYATPNDFSNIKF